MPGLSEAPGADFQVRRIAQEDFFWLKDFDCAPLNRERDSIYLFFAVHFRQTSFVAWGADAPIGFVLGFLPAGGSTAYVHYMFVREEHRRHGVGRALMRAFERAVQELGAQRVALYTARAEAFYRSLGYAPTESVFEAPVQRYVLEEKKVAPMLLELAPA